MYMANGQSLVHVQYYYYSDTYSTDWQMIDNQFKSNIIMITAIRDCSQLVRQINVLPASGSWIQV